MTTFEYYLRVALAIIPKKKGTNRQRIASFANNYKSDTSTDPPSISHFYRASVNLRKRFDRNGFFNSCLGTREDHLRVKCGEGHQIEESQTTEEPKRMRQRSLAYK